VRIADLKYHNEAILTHLDIPTMEQIIASGLILRFLGKVALICRDVDLLERSYAHTLNPWVPSNEVKRDIYGVVLSWTLPLTTALLASGCCIDLESAISDFTFTNNVDWVEEGTYTMKERACQQNGDLKPPPPTPTNN
jgi:hypothetical protein